MSTQPTLNIGTSRTSWPFSRGLVAESLVNAGADPAAAAAAARRVEQGLRQLRRPTVTPEEVKHLMVAVAHEVIGPEVGQRAQAQTPAFADIMVEGKKRTLPFSRGVLARNLEDAGLSSPEAYTAATQIDLRLRQAGRTKVTPGEIDTLAEEVLEQKYGEPTRQTYLHLKNNRGRLIVVSDDHRIPTPFSKGVLLQSMLAAGVGPDVARKVARQTQRELRGQEDRIIHRSAIRTVVEQLLRNEVGPDISDRYRLLRVLRRPPRPLIVLLGGVSGTGKSFLAAEIAYRLGIARVISTDSIREVMRATVSPALLPTLHASTFNAWEAVVPPSESRSPHPSREELMAGFREQVQQVSVGLSAVVRRSIEEGASLILEGVHLVPGYLRPDSFAGALIVPMLVTLSDDEEHRRHFESRDIETAASRPLHRYMQYFDEIRMMQEELETLSVQEGVALLDGLTLDESADQAVDIVLRGVMVALTSEERIRLLGSDPAELLIDAHDPAAR
ncbi:2-phosphoglycerate kinase [Deinococcus sp.]|uniref:2-phosphoglycerate kinase n=1 Tax=Deinococcus sp. TaxID=47478 RepID=UPI0025C00553|nr:2-phosphoglycerate kinase [Deinococcus sp.]